MNYRLLLKTIGIGLMVVAAFLIVPIVISLAMKTGEEVAFLSTAVVCAAAGSILVGIKNNRDLIARDGLVSVVVCWFVMSLAGAMPLFITGTLPTYMDCFFEAASGFTTTGATVLTDVSVCSYAMLMWRALMHWIGGMGIIVFMLIIISRRSAKSVHLMSVESTGPFKGKLAPTTTQSAKALFTIYAVLTGSEIVALLFAGMPVFDSFLHAFSTAGTGGFSMTNASVGEYNSVAIDVIITVFMLLFGLSFVLYYQISRGNLKAFAKSTEFKVFIAVVAGSITVIMLNVASFYGYDYGQSLRYAAFTVAATSSTTGFCIVDYEAWPMLSKCIIVGLMFFGAMAGSTGGGIKYSRVIIAAKAIKRDLKKMLHPNLVSVVKMDGAAVSERVVSLVQVFIVSYVALLGLGTLLISLDNFDFTTSFTSVLSALSNIGPGLSLVGPVGNYAMFSGFSKGVLSVCMIAGRLEIFPFLIMLAPRTWRR